MQSPKNDRSHDSDILSFDGMLIIVGGGAVDLVLLRQLKAAGAYVVAADGGANTCREADIVPCAIIGDMDSVIDIAAWEGMTKIIAIMEQATTDFEKCIYSTSAPLTVAMGMTGKRLDHTLAALDVMARFAATRRIILIDEEDVAVGLTEEFSFKVAPGDRVSIHPLQEVTFESSRGLKYSLDNLTLSPGIRTGTSNESVNGTFIIKPAQCSGSWLIILSKIYIFRLFEFFLGSKDI